MQQTGVDEIKDDPTPLRISGALLRLPPGVIQTAGGMHSLDLCPKFLCKTSYRSRRVRTQRCSGLITKAM